MAHTKTINTPLEYTNEDDKLKIFGFWVFLGAEIVLFSCLFATYLIYQTHTAGGPTPMELFKEEVPGFSAETFILLTSSFTCGLGTYELRRRNKTGVLVWMIITLLLGMAFLGLEAKEFITYALEGHLMSTSAFMSSFFTLVGTHGCHVTLGCLWMISILIQVAVKGVTPQTSRKIFIIGLYWHFLDVVWVFLFTAVYLNGILS